MKPADVVVKSGRVAGVACGTWLFASPPADVACLPRTLGIRTLQPAGGT